MHDDYDWNRGESKSFTSLPFPVIPAIVYVFSFIWFLLLHKSLLMPFTLRRTAWVLIPQGARRFTGPTGKNNSREGTRGATISWKKSIQLSSAVNAELPWKGVLLHWGFCLNWVYVFLCTTVPTPYTPFPYQSKVGARGGGERGQFMSLIC